MNSHIPEYIKEANAISTPEEGTRTPAIKNDPCNNRPLPKSEEVRHAAEESGAHKHAVGVQAGKNWDFMNQSNSGCGCSDE